MEEERQEKKGKIIKQFCGAFEKQLESSDLRSAFWCQRQAQWGSSSNTCKFSKCLLNTHYGPAPVLDWGVGYVKIQTLVLSSL